MECASPEVRIFTDHTGMASVFPTPVIARKQDWSAGPVLGTGASTAQTVRLPAGRWRLSLQYFSPVDMTLQAPGFSQPLKAALDGQRPNTISLANDGQYWPAGVFVQRRAGPVRLTLDTADAERAAGPDRLRRPGIRRQPRRGARPPAPDAAAREDLRALDRLVLRGHRAIAFRAAA